MKLMTIKRYQAKKSELWEGPDTMEKSTYAPTWS